MEANSLASHPEGPWQWTARSHVEYFTSALTLLTQIDRGHKAPCLLCLLSQATLTLSLRRAELSGWFFYTPPEQISRGNVAEWLIEYFFNGMSREALRVR
eukprot:3405245-Amphidinium_carterae.1